MYNRQMQRTYTIYETRTPSSFKYTNNYVVNELTIFQDS